MKGGQKISGCELTPQMYRDDPVYYASLRSAGWHINDVGDLPFPELGDQYFKPDPTHVKGNNSHQVGISSQMIYESFVKEREAGNFVLTIGGDHSIALGTLAGASDKSDCCVFFIDAHGDSNVPEISPSGNFHGMPVGCHLGLSRSIEQLPGWGWFKAGLKPSNVVFIGLRDLDEIEKDVLYGLGCHVFTPVDILRMGGIKNVLDVGLERVNPHRHLRIHLSFDIDACDPAIAPSTGTISAGGLSYVEALFIPQYLWETGCLCSMDLVEINPNILQGALAGHHDCVITKENMPDTLHEVQRRELETHPKITLDLGWEIIKRGLGLSFKIVR